MKNVEIKNLERKKNRQDTTNAFRGYMHKLRYSHHF